MNWKKVFAVIRREYIERVRKKGFWIATLLIPGLMLLYVAIQVFTAHKAGGERQLGVVDTTGRLYPQLVQEVAAQEAQRQKESPGLKVPHWVLQSRAVEGDLEKTKEALRKEVLGKKINAYLVLTPELLAKEQVQYYSTTVTEFSAMGLLERALNHIRLREKIVARGLPAEIGNDLEKRIDWKPFRVTGKGAEEEKGAGIMAAFVFFFLMYGSFFVYGAQVMRGVLEEKTNRIVEIIIASVRPTELMIGKMVGIGLVGITQYLVWALIAMNLSLPGIAAALASTEMGAPKIPVSMLGYFILYFILGYFLYASVYLAIAAPFNTDQEAQQLAMIPMILIVGGVAVYPAVLNNPSGTISVAGSIFPFTASLTMFLRTAISEVPSWQIALSVASLLLTTFGIAWFAGRVYRVGILMYGKKPTIPEIIRWVRYTPGKAPQPGIVQAS
ncbi:MAG: ABC transporter permease [Thermoanaerobaculia bacterium]